MWWAVRMAGGLGARVDSRLVITHAPLTGSEVAAGMAWSGACRACLWFLCVLHFEVLEPLGTQRHGLGGHHTPTLAWGAHRRGCAACVQDEAVRSCHSAIAWSET